MVYLVCTVCVFMLLQYMFLRGSVSNKNVCWYYSVNGFDILFCCE